MRIQHVRQGHWEGCFPACVAMLLGTSYMRAYKALYPGRNDHKGDIPTQNVWEALESLGFDPHVAKARQIRNFRYDAIGIIRWRGSKNPVLAHAFVWDSQRRVVIDPWKKYKRHTYESQLEHVFYVNIARARKLWKQR